MTSLVRHVTFDCADPDRPAQFRSRVVGYPLHAWRAALPNVPRPRRAATYR